MLVDMPFVEATRELQAALAAAPGPPVRGGGFKCLDARVDGRIVWWLAAGEERQQAPAHTRKLGLCFPHANDRNLLGRRDVVRLKERRGSVFFPLAQRLRLLPDDVAAAHRRTRYAADRWNTRSNSVFFTS